MVTVAETIISKWYTTSDGEFNKQWWNSAVAITAVADIEALSPGAAPNIESMLNATYTKAGPYWYFINQYYDEEG